MKIPRMKETDERNEKPLGGIETVCRMKIPRMKETRWKNEKSRPTKETAEENEDRSSERNTIGERTVIGWA